MKKIVRYIALLLLLPFAALAQEKSAESDPFHNWQVYYYLNKDTSKIPDFLKWLQESGTLDKHPGAEASMEGFLTVIFADNQAQADGWAHSGNFTGKVKEVLDYAVKPPAALDAKEIKTPGDFDMMWGAFYASGNDQYLKKITDALDKSKPLSGDAKADATTRAAAMAVLGANMTQHEAVERFLTGESQRKDATGESLKTLVENVRKQREEHALPFHDGDFSALMVVADPEVVTKEMSNPSGNAVHIQDMLRVKNGDKRTIVLVFAGMQLTTDYQSDVTYDVQIKNPAGKIYSDSKDIVAMKMKVPTRYHLFNNQQAVTIAFDRKDARGRYTINVTLKDNVGKKSIVLTKELTLKKNGKK